MNVDVPGRWGVMRWTARSVAFIVIVVAIMLSHDLCAAAAEQRPTPTHHALVDPAAAPAMSGAAVESWSSLAGPTSWLDCGDVHVFDVPRVIHRQPVARQLVQGPPIAPSAHLLTSVPRGPEQSLQPPDPRRARALLQVFLN